MLQKQGWHKCTDAEKKALGIKGPRSSSSYGAADETFFHKGAYMIAMSDLNFTNIFDPHNVSCGSLRQNGGFDFHVYG